jgi:hypothetical protein
MTYRLFFRVIVISLALGCAACAHPIDISPDVSRLPRNEAKQKIEKKVAYVIAPSDRTKKVKTAGGGGDSVEYAPYQAVESGLYLVLADTFAGVYPMSDAKDQSFIRTNEISYVFVPTITTTSSSRNAFFWPPTDFSLTIECVAFDISGGQVWRSTVNGEGGLIPVKEVISDFGLAGRRAAQDALLKLSKEIDQEPVFRK